MLPENKITLSGFAVLRHSPVPAARSSSTGRFAADQPPIGGRDGIEPDSSPMKLRSSGARVGSSAIACGSSSAKRCSPSGSAPARRPCSGRTPASGGISRPAAMVAPFATRSRSPLSAADAAACVDRGAAAVRRSPRRQQPCRARRDCRCHLGDAAKPRQVAVGNEHRARIRAARKQQRDGPPIGPQPTTSTALPFVRPRPIDRVEGHGERLCHRRDDRSSARVDRKEKPLRQNRGSAKPPSHTSPT